MIGTLTFHRAHNYGSVLQSYALQYWLQLHGYKSTIIDLYTERSKEQYKIFPAVKAPKGIIRNLIFLCFYPDLKRKWYKFNYFQENVLTLTKAEYSNSEDLERAALPFTTYITGSDQIWNTACYDFDWSYYLEFAKTGNFISYATSFGPIGKAEQKHNVGERLKENILRYNSISVRDEGSAEIVKDVSGKDVEITVDPTLLLPKEAWEALISQSRDSKFEGKLPDKYIFFYSLKRSADDYAIIRKIKKQYHLPVIITDIRKKEDLLINFDRKLDAGPVDFLSLIKNAQLVVTSSFHGTAFSILFEKKFFSINGMTDNRISNLLRGTGLEKQSINVSTKLPAIGDIDINYAEAKVKLGIMTAHSETFLKEALREENHGNL